MKTRSKQGHRRFQLEILSYGNSVLHRAGFGRVENEKVDHFLASALGKKRKPADEPPNRPAQERIRTDAKARPSRAART